MSFSKKRDYYAGALMMLLGVSSSMVALKYDLGTLTKMGTGYFPLVLSVLLTLLGAGIALTATATAPKDGGAVEAHGLAHGNRTGPDWRGWLAILIGVLAFVVLAQFAGLAPATFGCVFISAMGDRSNTWKGAGILAICVTIFSVALFHYGLRIQIPVFGRL